MMHRCSPDIALLLRTGIALFFTLLFLLPPPLDAATRTRLSGNWERGLQMLSEEQEDIAQEADIDSEFLFDRFKLKFTHPFTDNLTSTLEYVHENKDFTAYDTYDNMAQHINTSLSFPVAEGWLLKLSNRTWWKDYQLLPQKDNFSVVSGALLTYHPRNSVWDFSFNYYYKTLDYDDDVQQRYEDQRVHTVVLSAARELTEDLRVNVRGRQKMYDFETRAGLTLRTASIGFDYEF